MSMTVLDVLVAARALIEDPARWCPSGEARDADGRSVKCNHPDAARWSALGGVDYITRNPGIIPCLLAWQSLTTAAQARYGTSENIGTIGSSKGHAAVLACFDHAIAAARAEAERQAQP